MRQDLGLRLNQFLNGDVKKRCCAAIGTDPFSSSPTPAVVGIIFDTISSISGLYHSAINGFTGFCQNVLLEDN